MSRRPRCENGQCMICVVLNTSSMSLRSPHNSNILRYATGCRVTESRTKSPPTARNIEIAHRPSSSIGTTTRYHATHLTRHTTLRACGVDTRVGSDPVRKPHVKSSLHEDERRERPDTGRDTSHPRHRTPRHRTRDTPHRVRDRRPRGETSHTARDTRLSKHNYKRACRRRAATHAPAPRSRYLVRSGLRAVWGSL